MIAGSDIENSEVVEFALRLLKSNLEYDVILALLGKESATDDELVDLSQQCEELIDEAMSKAWRTNHRIV